MARRAVSLVLLATLAASPAWAQQTPPRAGWSSTGDAATSRTRPVRQGPTEVYLLRGLFNVFSLGMDSLSEKLRAQGMVTTVANHTSWSSLADGIIAARQAGRPAGRIVLIGHSLGGNDVVSMAEKLGRHGIVVDLLIPVDATAPAPIPANVRRAVNYFQAGNGWSSPIRPGAGFRGQLINADLESNRRDLNDGSVGHISIDKSGRIHRDIMVQIATVSAAPRPARRAATPPPRPQATAEAAATPATAPAQPATGAQVTGSITPPR
jgi:hypothetical protein